MSERCPLGIGIHWENRDEIPEVCLEQCGKFMTADGSTQLDGEYDIFPNDSSVDCQHPYLETEDCSLQRGDDSERVFGVTDQCGACGHEYGAQSYMFTCDHNQQSCIESANYI